ncbi:hypothetical protein [Tateyamaria sp.]|uniref:hypothetical protein n=1 Tax=Tateyamaria sp. TaxID=1929288 RepID=UPI00329DD1D9
MTERHYLRNDQKHTWQSREHRRGLSRVRADTLSDRLQPEKLNVWIGSGFLVGSAFFALCSAFALFFAFANAFGLSEQQINVGFFFGSIFFTLAAYLQLFQAANTRTQPAASPPHAGIVAFGWRPQDIGWLGCFLQFLGTLLFNASTFMTLHPSGNWLRDELVIWGPDIFGSVLFLASGYLAFAETSHGYWSWHPAELSWWVVATGLAGCVAFMISAIYAFVPQSGSVTMMVEHSIGWTLVGAVCFFLSAALILIESR